MSFRDNSGPGSQAQPRLYVEALWRDVKFGYRMLLKSPSFTVVAILTLALGIGANTAIFSLVNAVMLKSLPVRNPAQLFVARWSSHQRPNVHTSSYGDCGDSGRPRADSGGCSFSYSMFQKIRAQADIFESVAAFAGPGRLELSGSGPASLVQGELVSGDYFETLGVGAALGRTIQPSDEQPGAPSVVVLSYPYWQRVFGGAQDAIGKTIRLNGTSSVIVGVIDPIFTRLTPGKSVDLWIPLTQLAPLGLLWDMGGSEHDSWWLTVVVRPRPGLPLAQASAAASLLFRNETLHGIKPSFKEVDAPAIALLPAQTGLVGIRAMVREPLYLTMAAVALVLLVACANVAGLLLARSAAREKEIAVRLALGASRARLTQQLLTESLLLSLTGAALGAVFAFWGVRGMSAFFDANAFPMLNIGLQPDLHVLLFTVAMALLTGVSFGLAPAFRETRIHVAPTLKANAVNVSNSSHAGSRRFGLGSSLVVGQMALSVVILIGAGLLLRTLDHLRNVDPGFDPRNILLFSIDPPHAGYPLESIPTLYEELRRRLATLPGVTSVSYSNDRLLQHSQWTSDIKLPGQTDTITLETQMLAVGPDFFETMRIPLLRGRTFQAADLRSTHFVVVVNQAFVEAFLHSRDPIGLRFEQDKRELEIVGVVANTKYEDLRKAMLPTAFIPLANSSGTFELRSAMPSSVLIPMVKSTVSKLDENLPIFSVRTQSQTIDRLLFNERLLARLVSLFGLLALGLTCIGVYGLLAYQVAQRTREFGVRMALGAPRHSVLRLVLRHGLALAFIGVAIGIATSVALTRYLQSLLFGVNATDPITFGAVASILLSIAILACYLPARHATRVDPIVALRYE